MFKYIAVINTGHECIAMDDIKGFNGRYLLVD